MSDEASEIVAGDAVALEQGLGGLDHFAHGKFVHGLAVLMDVVHLLVDGVVRGRMEAATGRHHERTAAGAIDFVMEIDHAQFALRSGLDEDCAGAVAEEDAGGAVGVVDDGRHGVGADDEDFFVLARLDELATHLQGVDEAGAGGGDVESPGAFGAEAILHETGGGGEEHVGGDGADDDDFDIGGIDAALGEAEFGGFYSHVAGGHAGLDDVPLLNADAGGDPLIGGFNHFFQIGVGEKARRRPGSEGADFGTNRHTRPKSKRQTMTPECKRIF